MESDPEIRAFMQKYCSNIQTFTKRGKVQNIFNFFYDKDFKNLIKKITHQIMKYYANRFKINNSLAFLLNNTETKELRYDHSSFNNAQILETALLISSRKKLVNILNSLAEKSFYDSLTPQIPNGKWCKFQTLFSM